MFLKFFLEIEDKINIKATINPEFRTPPRLKMNHSSQIPRLKMILTFMKLGPGIFRNEG